MLLHILVIHKFLQSAEISDTGHFPMLTSAVEWLQTYFQFFTAAVHLSGYS